jgi:hypothetical protein
MKKNFEAMDPQCGSVPAKRLLAAGSSAIQKRSYTMMKRLVSCVALAAVLMGCAGGRAVVVDANSNSPGIDLDAAIREASSQMGERLPGGTKIALVSVASSSEQLSEYVISRLEAALVSDRKLVVVDRANLDKIREEQGFQASGEVDDDSAKSIGKLLGAGAIVTGGFTDLGDVYSLTFKAINIETATVAVSYPADITKSARIETMLASGGGAAGRGARPAQASGSAAVAQTPPPAPAQPEPPAYKIGDTGPAGGLVFYDKGNNSGGWRYMEAAPTDIDRKLYATEEGVEIESQRAVGTGKSNTQTIMVQANNRGGGFGWAAQACDALEVNGFDDWFLPSRDEIHYMYGNLHMRNLGGFSLDWYWSSTYGSLDGPWGAHYWWAENFSDGKQETHIGNRGANYNRVYSSGPRQFSIRAVRAF